MSITIKSDISAIRAGGKGCRDIPLINDKYPNSEYAPGFALQIQVARDQLAGRRC
jgi:outer membrane protein assembly factor BamD (BamD/ComL family)